MIVLMPRRALFRFLLWTSSWIILKTKGVLMPRRALFRFLLASLVIVSSLNRWCVNAPEGFVSISTEIKEGKRILWGLC